MERYTVNQYGFNGLYYPVEEPAKPGLAVVVLGGSEGNENVPREVSRLFSEQGIPALGVCYWNVPGLPENFVEVPLEPFEKVLEFLNRRGFREIYLYGISQGAKTALLVASLMSGYSGVIALSPIHCIWNGTLGNKSLFKKRPAEACEFTYRDYRFPFMRYRISAGKGLRNLLVEQQANFAYTYEEPLLDFREETAIPVEKINGDILFIHPKEDLMWPSPAAVDYMIKRLRDKAFPHKAKVLCYEKASHILVPLNPKQLRFFKVERLYPEECRKSREDAFAQCVSWLLQDPAERASDL